jgi:hypothetical protein
MFYLYGSVLSTILRIHVDAGQIPPEDKGRLLTINLTFLMHTSMDCVSLCIHHSQIQNRSIISASRQKTSLCCPSTDRPFPHMTCYCLNVDFFPKIHVLEAW